MTYISHFNEKSQEYRQFRPEYPKELYAYLAQLVPNHHLAWDVGTGNGQAAAYLAEYFTQVVATDISQPQLDAAIKKPNIQYQLWPAEKTGLQDQSVDLITIAQALHWFDLNAFYQEVHRVAAASAIIAAWCYSLSKINTEIDAVVSEFYYNILGEEYWAWQRKYIDEFYLTIPFPFEKITSPFFTINKKMNLKQFIGYLQTWSAVKEYQKRNKISPLELILVELETAWGDPEAQHLVHWPIHLLMGKVS